MADAAAICLQLQSILAQTTSPHMRFSPFRKSQPPNISLRDYTERLCSFMHCPHECFVLALVYLDRVAAKCRIDETCIHRTLLLSLVVAAKFWDDTFCKNTFYAQVGGVSIEELNDLEVQFLRLLEFELWVGEDVYQTYENRLKALLSS